MASNEVILKVVFANRQAMESLSEAIELVSSALESAPWSSDLREALEKLTYAAEHIECLSDDDCDDCDCDGDCDACVYDDPDIVGVEFEDEDEDDDWLGDEDDEFDSELE